MENVHSNSWTESLNVIIYGDQDCSEYTNLYFSYYKLKGDSVIQLLNLSQQNRYYIDHLCVRYLNLLYFYFG